MRGEDEIGRCSPEPGDLQGQRGSLDLTIRSSRLPAELTAWVKADGCLERSPRGQEDLLWPAENKHGCDLTQDQGTVLAGGLLWT